MGSTCLGARRRRRPDAAGRRRGQRARRSAGRFRARQVVHRCRSTSIRLVPGGRRCSLNDRVDRRRCCVGGLGSRRRRRSLGLRIDLLVDLGGVCSVGGRWNVHRRLADAPPASPHDGRAVLVLGALRCRRRAPWGRSLRRPARRRGRSAEPRSAMGAEAGVIEGFGVAVGADHSGQTKAERSGDGSGG